MASWPRLRLCAAGVSLPHSAKAEAGGEDAFLVSECGLGAIGVADGVGGWAAEGIDPAIYPRRFMAACQEALQQRARWTEDDLAVEAAAEAVQPGSAAVAALQAAYHVTREPGSSTAIVGIMLPGGRLSVASLGDCGLRVVRGGRVQYASQVQEHQWNMPLQLSWPEFYDCGSRPADAERQALQLQPGDVVVMGSDGLWDNLWEEQLLDAVDAEQARGGGGARLAQRLAQRLASTAHRQSEDPFFVSPFSIERQERMGEMGMLLPASGGKRDDVTAVVACIEASPLP